ncbi:unnamed protein product [Spirodela intermedia]|uniref:Uncharacterized protein n=1 Tax=Spirodela intermedia TaxID=51605 RepID=A0A7I8KE40_SPIIN|nr:unnamed protein product [Spirodela intermedia]
MPGPMQVFFIPFFVPSHMNPMTDLACAFAARGVDATMVVTPANGALIQRTVERAASAGLPIRILNYPFPSAEVGLAEGVENLVSAPPEEEWKINRAVDLVQGIHERLLREHRPHAVVADCSFASLTYVARDLGIPRVVFLPFGAFPLVVSVRLMEHEPYAGLADGDNTPFLVPDVPDKVEMVKSELPNHLRIASHLTENMEFMRKSTLECFGAVLNTSYDLEPAYCDQFLRTECRRGFFVGPYALLSEKKDDFEDRDDKCLAWLETQETASVVFVGFGSFLFFSKEQHWEMARGLEASGRPFLWTLKESDFAGGGADWLPEGFEERTRGQGLVVRGWVPQMAILNHRATGAFVTHLGWNSLTEGLYAGVPMITWPLAHEQFISERLVVNILRVGVRMWDGYRSSLPEAAAKAVVMGDAIARTVSRLLPPGFADEEVEALRKQAAGYRARVRAAVKEGGAAYNDLTRLIDGLKAFRPEAEWGDSAAISIP